MTFLEMEHKRIDVGITKTDLAREIERRFKEKLTPPELIMIMKGGQSGKKAERVKEEVAQVLDELERKQKGV